MNYDLLAKSKLTREQYMELAVHLKFLVGIATNNGYFANFMTSICRGDLSVDNLENLMLHIFADFLNPSEKDERYLTNLNLTSDEMVVVTELQMAGENLRKACDIVLSKRTKEFIKGKESDDEDYSLALPGSPENILND